MKTAEKKSPPSPDPITRLFRACEPNEALAPDDPRYVQLDDVRGENLPRYYERSLRRSDPLKPDVKVFAGHRGVGKTSELYRLRKMLQEPDRKGERPFFVIFADVAKSLDLNDLDFPDLLVFLAGEIEQQLTAAEIRGFSATNTLLQSLWGSLVRELQAEVSLSGASVGAPFASLAVEFKNRPSARQQLRAAVEKQSTNLLAALNDRLQEATLALRKAKYEGIVLIVDGLDKLVRRDLDHGGNTHERLFIHRSEQLASLSAHVVYTVPISLIYSSQFTQLEQTFGEHHVPVSMIRLRGEGNSEPTADTPGMRKMKEMLEKRCAFAGVELGEVFDSAETCTYLCEMTGGHPRHLMMFVQAATNAVDELPITKAAAEKAVRNYANSLLREIPDDLWPRLREFDEPQDDISKDKQHQEMLLLLFVFEYMNGQPWYEVNPVLRTLAKYRG